MLIKSSKSGELISIAISRVLPGNYKNITKKRYWFDWHQEKDYDVYKLTIQNSDDILGLVSLETISQESRIQIRLLAVSKENRGKNIEYENIVWNLLAFAGRSSITKFGEWACISLVPKTELIEHYQTAYGFLRAGMSLFLDGMELVQMVKRNYGK